MAELSAHRTADAVGLLIFEAGMSLFDWLLVGHLVGDFLLQSDNMAENKGRQQRWMLTHVGLYMAVMTVILLAYGLTWRLPPAWVVAAWLFLLVTHILLDRRRFTARWMRFIGMAPDRVWLPIVVDQVFHLLTLGMVAQALTLVQG